MVFQQILVLGLLLGVSSFVFNHQRRKAPALSCLTCADVPAPEQCKHSQTCDDGESCFTHEYTDAHGRRAYRLGCMSKQDCPAAEVTGRRRRNSRSCHGCCSKDRCNFYLCHDFGWPSTFMAVSPTPQAHGYLGCGFGWDTCRWWQSDDGALDWTRTTGKHLPHGVQPRADHDGKDGFFLHIGPGFPGLAVLKTSNFQWDAPQCLTVWYYFQRADDVTSLAITLKDISSGSSTTTWTMDAESDRVGKWMSTHVQLPAVSFYLTVAATLNKGNSVAIDDFSTTRGNCSQN